MLRCLAIPDEIARFYSNPVLLECIFGLLSYYCVRYAVRRQLTPAMKPVSAHRSSIGTMILLPAIEEWQLLQRLPEIICNTPRCALCLFAVFACWPHWEPI